MDQQAVQWSEKQEWSAEKTSAKKSFGLEPQTDCSQGTEARNEQCDLQAKG